MNLKKSSPSQTAEAKSAGVSPILVSVEEGANALGISRTEIFRLIGEDRIKSVKIGKRRLIAVSEMRAFASRLQEESARHMEPSSAPEGRA